MIEQGTLECTPYSLNPHLPKVRAQAVFVVRSRGLGVRQAARYFGVTPGTVSKWLARAPKDCGVSEQAAEERAMAMRFLAGRADGR